MNKSSAIKAKDALSTYILAKDSNQPQLMKRAFTQDCELEMAVKTDAISFPAYAKGLDQVTKVLVTDFGDQYDNVRTFVLSRPESDYLLQFSCDWLVGMSARSDGAVRVGCGHYRWQFEADDGLRVNKLVIEIDAMSVLSSELAEPILKWTRALPYPWCTHRHALARMPSIDRLRPIDDFLRSADEAAD